jgi:acyl-CoA synthetase (AMP-forming)/AMP-acid ligase II
VQLLVRDVLRTAARRHPHRVAIGIDARTMTFGEVDAAARALAARLRAAAVGRGDRVGWVARNGLEGAIVHAACAYLGAVYTPFNPSSTPAELAVLIEVGKPAVVLSAEGRAGTTALDALPDAPPLTALPDLSEHDPMVVFFTSGTTGRPKGAVLSNRVERLRGGFDATPRGAHVSMFPQFHMAGWVAHLESWMRGDRVVWVDRAEPEQLFAAVERHAAHGTYLIPAVWRRVLDADRRGWDLSSLRVADTGTSVTSPELLHGIKDAFPGTTTSVVYGSTEAHRVCVLHDADLFAKPYSVGQPIVGAMARRDDATGELWVRSPVLFDGYFENPDATDEVLVDGWYRTGDVVDLDDDGFVSVVGRTKELIRTGGETVAPVEVEQLVRGCTGVADAAVAGMPDETWGEIVTAFVVAGPGVTLTLDGLQAELVQALARHKLPRRLIVVDAIPRTGATGQIARARLVALALEAGAA